MLFSLVSVVGGLTPGASAPGKPPPGVQKPGYAVGEETRTETGPRQQQDRPPPRSRPATTPGSAASSPGRAEDTPQPRQHAQQAEPPTLDSGPTNTTDHRHPGTTSAATIDSRTEDPPTDTIPAPAAGPPHGPPQRPQRQDSGRPDPTPDAITHAAQDAHRPRQRRPTTIDPITGDSAV